MRIITEEALGAQALDILEQAGAEIIVDGTLININDADALILSGDTTPSEALYAGTTNVRVAACLDRERQTLDLDRATRAGIVVLEPSRGEAASVADFAMASILQMARSRKDGAIELKGKTLGFLGFTPTAAEIAQRARGFGMDMLCFEHNLNRGRAMLYNVEPTNFVDLFVLSDFLVVLAPFSEETADLIGKDEIQLLKKDASLIFLTDPRVLRWNEVMMCLDFEYLNQFAIDLPKNHAMLAREASRYKGVTVTVAEAANTAEARRGNEVELARNILDVLGGRTPDSAVNVARVHTSERREAQHWCQLGDVLGQFLGQRLTGIKGTCRLEMNGILPSSEQEVITAYALAGLAKGAGEEKINTINAELWLREKGAELEVIEKPETSHDSLVMTMESADGTCRVAGDVLSGELNITQVDNYRLRTHPNEHILLVPHVNRPGMVGMVGTYLGEENVNIGGMVLGHQLDDRSTALMWVTLDAALGEGLAEKGKDIQYVERMEYIHLEK